MATQAACRVCAGELSLRVSGNGHAHDAASFAPSLHEIGRHGDLLECIECGTVQQPRLPGGDELHELYRGVEDEAYLAEETGRRATAAHLLDLIGAEVPGGRLLDVGCGHGLLLDEARQRGFEVVGLELSRAAARHARDTFALDVREVAIEDFEDAEGFDVVVLADVLEHLDDPVAAVERCARLLRPDGALCVVTPDPSSLTARIAGKRWWGYVPAHACLLPRATLRELLGASGLVISADVPLVRSFSARRWTEGLAERLGPLHAPLDAAARRLPEEASLSLALHDERVIIAQRVEVHRAPRPLVHDRGGPARGPPGLPAYQADVTPPPRAPDTPAVAPEGAGQLVEPGHAACLRVGLGEEHGGVGERRHVGYAACQRTGYPRARLDGARVRSTA